MEYHVEHPVRVINDALNQARLERCKPGSAMRATVGLAEIREGDFEHMIYDPKARFTTQSGGAKDSGSVPVR